MDLNIVCQFHWDAEKHFIYHSDEFERFIDEPWTADAWWELQVWVAVHPVLLYCLTSLQLTLLADGVPFFILLYADKTKLLLFGTQKGYPVLAHCANLPVELRNGEYVEGGRLVSWLPIVSMLTSLKSSIITNTGAQVEEDSVESGKKGFVYFKWVVWHKAFYKIVESIEKYAFCLIVVMGLGRRYILLFSSFQLIMKNSTLSWLHELR